MFEQAGSSGENVHYHIVIFIPEYMKDETIGKYEAAIAKVRGQGAKKRGAYKGAIKKRDLYEMLDAKASICEEASDGNGMAAAIYAAHELRDRQDSFSTEFSSVTKR